MNISWEPPPPRKGLPGAWDRFVGPGATRAEFWLQAVLAVAAGAAAPLYAAVKGLGWSAAQMIAAGLLAFDLAGGIITNATSTAKRWYHRQGQGPWQHFTFVAVHGLHVFIVAWLFRSMDWTFFGIVLGYLLVSTAVILSTPLYLQRPVAFAVLAGAILLNYYAYDPVAGMQWFVPFLFLKLEVSHLLKEAPFRPRWEGDRED